MPPKNKVTVDLDAVESQLHSRKKQNTAMMTAMMSTTTGAATGTSKPPDRVYPPGHIVHFTNQIPEDPPWRIVSTRGRVLDEEDPRDQTLLKTMRSIKYLGAELETWVFASTVCRNPRLIPSEYGYPGDGEYVQIRGVVSKTKQGVHHFHQFKEESETLVIMHTFGRDVMVTPADVAKTYIKDNRIADTEKFTRGNEICVISDPLYYSQAACLARIACVRAKHPDVTPRYVAQGEAGFDEYSNLSVVPAKGISGTPPAVAAIAPILVDTNNNASPVLRPEDRVAALIRQALQSEPPDVVARAITSVMLPMLTGHASVA